MRLFFQHNGKGLIPVQKSKKLTLENEEIYKKNWELTFTYKEVFI